MILCDTRQQAGKHLNIDKYFERIGIETERCALYVGDYAIANDQKRSVDTKQDVLELAKDIKKGAYNPWIPESGRKDFEALVENTLTMMISECAKAFERLPIIQDIDILRNVIYSGVWVRYGEIIHERQEKGEGHA